MPKPQPKSSSHGAHGSRAAPEYREVPAIHAAGASDTAHHHGHTIIPASTLMAVLIALLAFTGLTVGASMLEAFLARTFEVAIPAWVNVSVALSIAAVKTTLVVMFFMGLRYDNPINTMIFMFTLMTVASFLGFTMIDLGNRGTIDRFKAQAIVPGGLGLEQASVPITEAARSAAIANLTYDPDHAHHGPHGAPAGPARSSDRVSRPVRGVKIGAPGEHAKRDDHGTEH